MKKSILLATSAIIASGAVAVNAQAVDVELYGQVNKGVMGYSVGQDSEVAIVDNDVSSTRFGLRGEQQLDHGLTASVLMEAELQTLARATDNVTNGGTAPTAAAANGFLERHARVGLAGQWGALFVGRTSSATDGITEIDLGAVSDIMNSATDRIGGNITVDAAGNEISDLTDNIDGIAYDGGVGVDANEGDRADLVRYDSPIVNGLQARVAYVQDGDMDASVLYNAKRDALEIAAGVGYIKYNDTAAFGAQSAIAGSVSVAHDNGVSVTAALGKRYFDDTTANDPKFGYVKVGYQMGNTGVAVDYARHEDSLVTAAATSTTVNAYGVGVQQDLGHGVSAAAYWRKMDTHVAGTADERGVDVYGVNMRVKF